VFGLLFASFSSFTVETTSSSFELFICIRSFICRTSSLVRSGSCFGLLFASLSSFVVAAEEEEEETTSSSFELFFAVVVIVVVDEDAVAVVVVAVAAEPFGTDSDEVLGDGVELPLGECCFLLLLDDDEEDSFLSLPLAATTESDDEEDEDDSSPEDPVESELVCCCCFLSLDRCFFLPDLRSLPPRIRTVSSAGTGGVVAEAEADADEDAAETDVVGLLSAIALSHTHLLSLSSRFYLQLLFLYPVSSKKMSIYSPKIRC